MSSGLTAPHDAPTTRGTSTRPIFSVPHLTTRELRSALGGTAGRPTLSDHELARLRDQGTLLGSRVGRFGFLYPTFQIDLERRQVFPLVAKVNRALRGTFDPDRVLRWWIQPGDGLFGQRLENLHRGAELIAQARLEAVNAVSRPSRRADLSER